MWGDMKKLIFENVSGDYSYSNVYMANFYFPPFYNFFIQF